MLLFQFANIVAQNDIRISEAEGWTFGCALAGTVEEVELHIEPQGLYTSMEMYLDFSAAGVESGNSTSEIVFDFNLPQGTIVNDAWLWMPSPSLSF